MIEKRYIVFLAYDSAAFGTAPMYPSLELPALSLDACKLKLEPRDVDPRPERPPKERRRLQKLWGKRP